jgi:hypothetical protein
MNHSCLAADEGASKKPVSLWPTTKATPDALTQPERGWKTAVKPKPLNEKIQKGLTWLAQHQLTSGAWGQGETNSPAFAHSGSGASGTVVPSPTAPRRSASLYDEQVESIDLPNVTDTCIASLAFIRAGSSPSKGPYTENVRRAVFYVCAEIESADEQSPYITGKRNTRDQQKLSPYVDTFMAAMVLPEVLDQMPDEKSNKRVRVSLEKVLKKMAWHQKNDGTWSDQGWAATLGQSIAMKGIYRSQLHDIAIPEKMQQQTRFFIQRLYDPRSARFNQRRSAGVALYASSSSLSVLSDWLNSCRDQAEEAQRVIEESKDSKKCREARKIVYQFNQVKEDFTAQKKMLMKQLDDNRFLAGFGNNGGEEFYCYMNIGEMLVAQGGKEWKKWDDAISERLYSVQNEDGSWTGHHCISGRTFCTSAALLALMVDRTRFPTSSKTPALARD